MENKRRKSMKKFILVVMVAVLILSAACSANPLGVDGAELSDDTTESTPSESTSTSCDIAREAFLTGSQEQINAALTDVVADQSADASAREAAQNYLNENDEELLRELYKTSVQTYCSF